jgi:endonuclease/exonuclease/phosphatase family metal-dependent hydrolase
MKLAFATYNILHGYHTEQILDNIKMFINKGAKIICIQEAEIPIEKILPLNWQIEYYKVDVGCMLATIWDKSVVSLEKKETILFPPLSKPSISQKFTNYKNVIIPRGALITNFRINGKILRVTNVHSAWEGGDKQRERELRYLTENLSKKEKADYEIVAGDFNTYRPSFLNKAQVEKVTEIFSQYNDVFPEGGYTCDTSTFDPKDGLPFAGIFSFFFSRLKLRSRLDYIFTSNLKTISKEILYIPGSDHKPLVATFEF